MDLAPLDVFVVATRPRWCADDLTVGAAGRFPVVHDWCLDAPCINGALQVAWWTPAIHATRLRTAGLHLDLAAPGPRWLATLDPALTRRRVWAGTFAELATCPWPGGFAKPAEAKVPGLEAAWFDNLTDFADAATAVGLPGDAHIQVADRRCDLVVEHRCFVLDGRVLTASGYIDPAGDTWEPEWAGRHDLYTDDAYAYAAEVVAELAANQPGAYVLDVARERDGQWLVLEANPAWCAGWYGCDLTAVVDTIVAASQAPTGPGSTSRHEAWVWEPDAALVADTARRAPLRHRTPLWAPAITSR